MLWPWWKETSNSFLLFAENLLGSFVSSAYHDAGSNTDKVYLLQQYKNLPVYNQVLALAFKNGKLVSQAGHFLESVQKKSANISSNTGI
ncbi:MAG: hypothetical protein IPQ27_08515 [Chitinophagaceae bacterium]|nr:hypothetical protein [Chitinophagaceae bacterium]